jgi:CBS domain-containing protein
MMKKLTTADIKVSKVMTKNLIIVSLGSMVVDAVKKMVDFDVECLPVVDSKGILHGLVTFRDIVTKVIYSQADVRKLKVEDIMAKDLVTCNLSCTVLDVVKIMKNKHLRRIPVVNARNKLVGLVTDFDLALFGWGFK